MRLVSHTAADGARVAAVVSGETGPRLLDLSDLAGEQGLAGLISDPYGLDRARERVSAAADVSAVASLPLLADARLLSPVRPGKILCLGYNYRGHVPAGGDPMAADPEYPDVFVKTPNVLRGPDDSVPLPTASDDVDYEGEIAVVIGTMAHEVSLENAMAYVAGYTLFNDVSARDWQRRSSQWELGKCFDGFGPLGPALVTKDEVPDIGDLLLEVERDGVITVAQRTSTMIFAVPVLVHLLSQVMTLDPGDVISTGTPQKLPAAQSAHRPLASGDTVTIRVESIGELRTTFSALPAVGIE